MQTPGTIGTKPKLKKCQTETLSRKVQTRKTKKILNLRIPSDVVQTWTLLSLLWWSLWESLEFLLARHYFYDTLDPVYTLSSVWTVFIAHWAASLMALYDDLWLRFYCLKQQPQLVEEHWLQTIMAFMSESPVTPSDKKKKSLRGFGQLPGCQHCGDIISIAALDLYFEP